MRSPEYLGGTRLQTVADRGRTRNPRATGEPRAARAGWQGNAGGLAFRVEVAYPLAVPRDRGAP